MHRCLRIYEILEHIFEDVIYQTQNQRPFRDRPSLLAVLKTCRSFSVPAMKLLWRDLSTILPLILTMPEDLVEVEELDQSSPFAPRTVTFRRDILPSDWERFDLYAPCVRQLGNIAPNERSSATFMVLDDKIWRELKRRDKPLLPNLTRMAASSNDMPTAALLLTPYVHQIKLVMHPCYVSSICRLIDDIPLRVPTLKILHLHRSTNWAPSDQALLGTALLDLLEKLNLEEFQCDWFNLSDEMVQALAQMPDLRKITILKDIPALARALHDFPFKVPRLKEISIWTNAVGPSPLAQILVALRPSSLEAFRVMPVARNIPCTQEELNDLISAIKTRCSPKSLTHFDFEGCTEPQPLDAPPIADAKLLRPLFVFSNLRQFCLPAYPFEFTDAEVKELAMSWPLLEELSFRSSIVPTPPLNTRTTLRCLLWFSIYCRNLRSLSFVFNGTETFSEAELSMASDHPLSLLSVGYSVIADPDAVAAFFNIAFPNLALLDWTSAPTDEQNMRMWEEVETKIQRQPS
ncbi:hypothetical protein BJ912DRAFT_1146499 [Pholiota molesta]|nr:hypothetical protein BJ912DRAFT_1146499 [Pholiota molesta]